MNRTTTVRRALLAGALTIAALALAAGCGTKSSGGMGNMDHARPVTGSTSGAGFGATDVQFAQMMIPHHQQAVEMAVLAETRAGDPEIRQLAAQIKAAQDPEIKTMTGWLRTWGQPTQEASGHNMAGMSGMPGMMSDDETASLKAAKGVDFDRLFARMMIAHHNGAIQMAHTETTNGVNADAVSLAFTIEKAQAAEVTTLQKILDRL